MSSVHDALGQSNAVVTGAGAQSAVGFDAWQTAMGIRARLFMARRSELCDARGQPVVAALAGLPDQLYGFERLVALGSGALAEAHAGAWPAPLPLLLALPEPERPDCSERYGRELIETLAERSGAAIDLERSGVFPAGRAAGAQAFRAALDLLAAGAGGPEAVLVGGIDSYHHPEVLPWLDRQHRLHRSGAADGFRPGEGAAFVALAREDVVANAAESQARARTSASRGQTAAPSAGVRPWAKLCGVELGPIPEDGDRAATMAGHVERLARAWPGVPIEWVLSDVNGMRDRVEEWTDVALRALPTGVPHERVADVTGDLGAASGPLLVAVACTWWQVGHAPARAALVALHSDGADRGALLLKALGGSTDDGTGES